MSESRKLSWDELAEKCAQQDRRIAELERENESQRTEMVEARQIAAQTKDQRDDTDDRWLTLVEQHGRELRAAQSENDRLFTDFNSATGKVAEQQSEIDRLKALVNGMSHEIAGWRSSKRVTSSEAVLRDYESQAALGETAP